jgi:hypothetical protein
MIGETELPAAAIYSTYQPSCNWHTVKRIPLELHVTPLTKNLLPYQFSVQLRTITIHYYPLCVPPPQSATTVVGLAFQYNLHPFLTVSGHNSTFFIPIIFKSSSTSSLHLLRGLPLQLLQFVLTSHPSFVKDPF